MDPTYDWAMSGTARGSHRPTRTGVYTRLRRQILAHQIPPGAAISENELSQALGVSRTPVREALLLLAQEDLVRVFPKVGTFATRILYSRVAEAQFIREAIETASLASLVYPLRTDILDSIADNLRAQHAIDDQDVELFFSLDESFHRDLMELAGHGGSWSTVVAAKGHLDRARFLGLEQHLLSHDLIAEHQAVFDAIASQDVAEALKVLQGHLRRVFHDVRIAVKQHPEMFSDNPDAVPTRRTIAVWE